MNLNQLRFFLAVADASSFSKAAEQCCVTQPSLSNAIAQLESELEGRLFIRNTRQVSLTPLGEHLRPLIAEVLDAKVGVTQAARSFLNPSHKLIRIGMSPLINTQLVATALEPFRRKNPETEIIFKECLLDELNQRMDEHKIDLAFLLSEPRKSGQACETFYSEPLYYLPNEDQAAAPLPSGPVTLASISEETIMVSKGCGLADGLHHLFTSQGLKMQEYPGQALSYQVLEDWAGLGIGAAILPQSKISSRNNSTCPLHVVKDQPATFVYETVWNDNITQSRHVNDLLTHFKKVVPKLVEGLAA
ncbi:MAG: LysR family transcriptional regulator [Gammaproteobacteria bacterium]|nr:LysR family transcriptional regulator [Gammaproteobacteria bacterium]